MTFSRVRIRALILLLLAWTLLGVAVASARAATPPDPAANIPPGPLPSACDSAPGSATCINGVVTDLDQARSKMGLGPYLLPGDFTSLAPDRQAFILTNLDRTAYGLPPVPGLVSALDNDAAAGVRDDGDPQPSDSTDYPGFASNWAGGDPNMPMAYYEWMYDDGYGSGNLDCSSPGASGCWGHRHDVFFDPGYGGLAMGAAAGTDPQGTPGYAMLIGQTNGSYQPSYTYTWAQAQADGAGTNHYGSGGSGSGTGSGSGGAPHPVVRLRIVHLRVHGHMITVQIAAPRGAKLLCALTRRRGHRWGRDHFARCHATTIYRHVPRGSYRLRIRAAGQAVARTLRIG